MRGPLSTDRVLPAIASKRGVAHHRCSDCGVDLCENLKQLGFTEQLLHLIHGGDGAFHVLAHRNSRCFHCEEDYRSRY